jgi:hypothetical protein
VDENCAKETGASRGRASGVMKKQVVLVNKELLYVTSSMKTVECHLAELSCM